MLNNHYEAREMESQLAALYIGYQNRMSTLNPYFCTELAVCGTHWSPYLYLWRDAVCTDYHECNHLFVAMAQQQIRAKAWRERRIRMLRQARERLAYRLRDHTEYRVYASKQYNPSTWELRRSLADTVRKAFSSHKQTLPPKVLRAPLDTYTPTPAQWNAALELLAGLRNRLYLPNVVRKYPLLEAVFDAVRDNVTKIYPVARADRWKEPVWQNEAWYQDSMYCVLHQTHVSADDPNLIAYTQNGDKLMRNIQTRTKPGKYLQQFFGNVLTSDQIRYWAEMHQIANGKCDLNFVPNTDPDGWEWVYENAVGFSSCMMYNHPNGRHLASGLYGEDHPVRAYAHPDNNLALAWIGTGVVGNGSVVARAIVNTKTKEYVRLYGDSRLQTVLEAAGFTHSGGCLRDQVIHAAWSDDHESYICPYLDGHYTNVEKGVDRMGRSIFTVGDDGVDGQMANGLVSGKEYACDECGDRVDSEDDLTHVECGDRRVCQDCLDRHYVYAYGRRHQDYFSTDAVVECQSNGEYYATDWLSDHDIHECVYSGSFYFLDDLVSTSKGYVNNEDAVHLDYEDSDGDIYAYPGDEYELPDGKYCHTDDSEAILAEHYAEDEEETEQAEAA